MNYHKTPTKICAGNLDLLRCVFKRVIYKNNFLCYLYIYTSLLYAISILHENIIQHYNVWVSSFYGTDFFRKAIYF